MVHLQIDYLQPLTVTQVEGVEGEWYVPELAPWRLNHLTLKIDFSPFHFRQCLVEVAEQTVGMAEVEEGEAELQHDLWVGGQEEVVAKEVEAMVYPNLPQQPLVA